MAFPTRTYGNFGDEKVIRTAARGKIGSLMELPDGSLYRYTLAGAALPAGQLAQSPLAIANHDMDLVVAATVAVGVLEFTATLGGTAATADQYKDGWVYINDGPGEGHRYRIGAHAAVGSGAVMTIPIDEDGGVREALNVTTSLCGLMANPWNNSILFAATVTGVPVGFAPTEVASGEYCWLQTRGYATVWMQGTGVLGHAHKPSVTTAGSVDVHVATGDASPTVFVANSPLAVTTDYQWGFICIE
tara:strand:- start:603 stop:1340 length:738 start_codon:yes stop_codon:yes gene_type:complete